MAYIYRKTLISMILLMAEILNNQFIGSISHYPIIHRVLYIPGGARFQPSAVSMISYLCKDEFEMS